MELSPLITDPFDWPATMPELRTIDNLLRCGICCEFLNIAMILPRCSHNYCSQCIRRYMNYKSQCPACNTATIEGELRNNKVVDEIVKNFVAVRPAILKLCKGQGQRSATAPETPPRRRKDDKKLAKSAERASSMTPGTALAVKEATQYFTSETPKRAEPTTSSTPMNRSNEENISPPRMGSLAGDDSDDDDDVIIIDEVQPPPTAQALTSPGTSKKTDSKLLATRSDKSDCPVCGVAVAIKYMNSHLDACLKRSTELPRKPPKQKQERRKPLPKLVYNIMSDKELRKKLKEYKLVTQGTRKELIRRIQEYTVLFNAQCDSDDPVPVEDVIKYHERMEKIRNKPLEKKSNKTFRLKAEKGQDEETIAKSQQNYSKHHNKQFEDLIRTARERMGKLPNMDGVTGNASAIRSGSPAAEASAGGSCSKSDIETEASSLERIETETPRNVKSGRPEETAKHEEACDRLSVNKDVSGQHESSACANQMGDIASSMEQTVPTECIATDIAATVETETSTGNTILPEKSNIVGIVEHSRDNNSVDAEATEVASSVDDEPQSPTLFDNFSFSDEDFQTEDKDACQDGDLAAAGVADGVEPMGDYNIGVNGCQSATEGALTESSSVVPLTSTLDLQTSPVFNGGIHMDRTPLVESTTHNSAPASLSLDSEENQDSGERFLTRGRLRRKRKTILEQLDIDLSNVAEGETATRRASKRNKKSLD